MATGPDDRWCACGMKLQQSFLFCPGCSKPVNQHGTGLTEFHNALHASPQSPHGFSGYNAHHYPTHSAGCYGLDNKSVFQHLPNSYPSQSGQYIQHQAGQMHNTSGPIHASPQYPPHVTGPPYPHHITSPGHSCGSTPGSCQTCYDPRVNCMPQYHEPQGPVISPAPSFAVPQRPLNVLPNNVQLPSTEQHHHLTPHTTPTPESHQTQHHYPHQQHHQQQQQPQQQHRLEQHQHQLQYQLQHQQHQQQQQLPQQTISNTQSIQNFHLPTHSLNQQHNRQTFHSQHRQHIPESNPNQALHHDHVQVGQQQHPHAHSVTQPAQTHTEGISTHITAHNVDQRPFPTKTQTIQSGGLLFPRTPLTENNDLPYSPSDQSLEACGAYHDNRNSALLVTNQTDLGNSTQRTRSSNGSGPEVLSIPTSPQLRSKADETGARPKQQDQKVDRYECKEKIYESLTDYEYQDGWTLPTSFHASSQVTIDNRSQTETSGTLVVENKSSTLPGTTPLENESRKVQVITDSISSINGSDKTKKDVEGWVDEQLPGSTPPSSDKDSGGTYGYSVTESLYKTECDGFVELPRYDGGHMMVAPAILVHKIPDQQNVKTLITKYKDLLKKDHDWPQKSDTFDQHNLINVFVMNINANEVELLLDLLGQVQWTTVLQCCVYKLYKILTKSFIKKHNWKEKILTIEQQFQKYYLRCKDRWVQTKCLFEKLVSLIWFVYTHVFLALPNPSTQTRAGIVKFLKDAKKFFIDKKPAHLEHSISHKIIFDELIKLFTLKSTTKEFSAFTSKLCGDYKKTHSKSEVSDEIKQLKRLAREERLVMLYHLSLLPAAAAVCLGLANEELHVGRQTDGTVLVAAMAACNVAGRSADNFVDDSLLVLLQDVLAKSSKVLAKSSKSMQMTVRGILCQLMLSSTIRDKVKPFLFQNKQGNTLVELCNKLIIDDTLLQFGFTNLRTVSCESRFTQIGRFGENGKMAAVHSFMSVTDTKCIASLQNDINMLSAIHKNGHCPNVIRLLAYASKCEHPQTFYVLEYDEDAKPLSTWMLNDLKASGSVTYGDKYDIASGMIEAIKHCHEKGILLRGVCAAYFDVHLRRGKPSPLFTNFHSAVFANDDGTFTGNKEEKLPIMWLALESLLKCKFSFATDIHSLGLALLEVFGHGVLPYAEFQGDQWTKLHTILRMRSKPLQKPGMPRALYCVLLQCLSPKPIALDILQEKLKRIGGQPKDKISDKVRECLIKAALNQACEFQTEYPKELTHVRDMESLWTRKQNVPKLFEQLEIRYKDMCDQGTACHAKPEEQKSHDDPVNIERNNATVSNVQYRNCLLKENLRDESEKNAICELCHDNIPKHIRYESVHGQDSGHEGKRECTAIEFFVGTNHEKLSDFMSSNNVPIETRLAIYTQIGDVVQFLHGKKFIIGTMDFFIVDESRVVLGNLARLTYRSKEQILYEDMVCPFNTVPISLMRGGPLEICEQGVLCPATDIAMMGYKILELEQCVGRICNNSMKTEMSCLPQHFASMKEVGFSKRCLQRVCQAADTPEWLYSLLCEMTSEPAVRRPSIEEVMYSLKHRCALESREGDISTMLRQEEAQIPCYVYSSELPLNKRGTIQFQEKVRLSSSNIAPPINAAAQPRSWKEKFKSVILRKSDPLPAGNRKGEVPVREVQSAEVQSVAPYESTQRSRLTSLPENEEARFVDSNSGGHEPLSLSSSASDFTSSFDSTQGGNSYLSLDRNTMTTPPTPQQQPPPPPLPQPCNNEYIQPVRGVGQDTEPAQRATGPEYANTFPGGAPKQIDFSGTEQEPKRRETWHLESNLVPEQKRRPQSLMATRNNREYWDPGHRPLSMHVGIPDHLKINMSYGRLDSDSTIQGGTFIPNEEAITEEKATSEYATGELVPNSVYHVYHKDGYLTVNWDEYQTIVHDPSEVFI